MGTVLMGSASRQVGGKWYGDTDRIHLGTPADRRNLGHNGRCDPREPRKKELPADGTSLSESWKVARSGDHDRQGRARSGAASPLSLPLRQVTQDGGTWW